MKHPTSIIFAALPTLMSLLIASTSFAEQAEEPVSIAVQGAGIDAVVDLPADRAGEGPHLKRKEGAKKSNAKPETIEIKGSAMETIEYGTETKKIGNVRVRIPQSK